MMSYQSMLHKMNPNKIKKDSDNATAAAPLAERTRLLELNTFQLRTDHETRDETWTKQPTMLSTAR